MFFGSDFQVDKNATTQLNREIKVKIFCYHQLNGLVSNLIRRLQENLMELHSLNKIQENLNRMAFFLSNIQAIKKVHELIYFSN